MKILEIGKKLILLLFVFLSYAVHSQVGIGTTTPHASAVLDITSTNKGLLMPRMTEAQRDAIASPADGLMIYNTTTNCFNFRKVGVWEEMCNQLKIVTQPTSLTTCGNSVSLNVVATAGSSTSITYTWRRNNVSIVNGGVYSGQGTNRLTITNSTSAHAGNYDVVVSSGQKTITSNIAIVQYAVSTYKVTLRKGGRLTTYDYIERDGPSHVGFEVSLFSPWLRASGIHSASGWYIVAKAPWSMGKNGTFTYRAQDPSTGCWGPSSSVSLSW